MEKLVLGKTTIINLINRFYEIQKGEILLDGINIKDINLRSLRKNIGIILQDPFIFARTIKENIALNENLSDEAIIETLKLSSAESFITSLPNGIDEIAHERGSSFSAGQKQLMTIARVILADPKIVNVDKIIVLNNGEILEQGSHTELMSNSDGYYYKLYNAYYKNLVA